MGSPSLLIASRQRFACVGCGKCCRRWHVALSAAEVEALTQVVPGPDIPRRRVTHIGGHAYIAHRPNGHCVFLDSQTNRCQIHSQLGAAAKPLGCQIYPLNICSSLPGQVSVMARMDCPAVQQNRGEPLTRDQRVIADFAERLGVQGDCPEHLLEELEPVTAQRLTRALIEAIDQQGVTLPPAELAQTLLVSAERFEKLGSVFLNDGELLETIMPSFWMRSVKIVQEQWVPHLGAWGRALFRAWLANYLRRDEDWLGRPWSRVLRTADIGRLFFGCGSLRRLSPEHPDIPLRRVHMFRNLPSGKAAAAAVASAAPGVAVWECYWRWVRTRLETHQFFGVAYYGVPYFQGLRTLFQTYPLVLAAARVQAAAAGRRDLEAGDICYAVGAIDHSFGRSPLLKMRTMRAQEDYFTGERFRALIRTLG